MNAQTLQHPVADARLNAPLHGAARAILRADRPARRRRCGLDAFAETTRDYLDLALALALERTWDLIESTPSLAAWVVFVLGAMTGWSAYVRSRCARERRNLEQLRTDLMAGC